METLALIAGVAFVVWQLINIRNEIASLRISTTFFMSIESEERDEHGLPNKAVQLEKKLSLSTTIVPGMEYSIPGESKSLIITRVVVDEFGRGVHLTNKIVSESQVEQEASSYGRGGWERGI